MDENPYDSPRGVGAAQDLSGARGRDQAQRTAPTIWTYLDAGWGALYDFLLFTFGGMVVVGLVFEWLELEGFFPQLKREPRFGPPSWIALCLIATVSFLLGLRRARKTLRKAGEES
jgi:hypothetical protein